MTLDLSHILHEPTGPQTAPPLMIAHGLFGSARNFNTLGKRLATNRRVILLDMRNHGDSPWDDDVSYPAMARDLAHMIETLADGRAVLLGHSMGGKAAMAMALTRPELLAGLVIADIAPVDYGHTHYSILEAMAAADLSGITRRSQGDALMARALPDPMLRSFILQNLIFQDGQARWRLNVTALKDGMDTLVGWPASLGGQVHSGPTLAIYGDASPYVGAHERDALARHFPDAAFHPIPGAGHWLHAEKPDAFCEALSGWLNQLD